MQYGRWMINMMFWMLGLVLFAQEAPAIWNNIGFYHLRTNSLKYTTAAQSIYAGNCSGIMTVKTYNPSNILTNVASNLTVNLTGAGTTTFYSDSGCTNVITSVTVTTGTNSASFYFIDTSTSPVTINATATSYATASQTETLSTNPFVWVGLGADANWNTAANWSGGAVPGSSNRTLFDGTCVSNCSPVINVAASVERVRMTSAYSGTITQNSGKTITVAAGGWIQSGGTFSGSDAAISVSGPVVISGGTFTSTSSTLTFNSSFTVSGTGTYNHHSGTFIGTANFSNLYITPGSAVFNNVKFNGYGVSSATITGTMQIDGDLNCDDSQGAGGYINSGTINLKGNFSLTGGGWRGGGSGLVRMVGTGTQTMSMDSAADRFPSLEIASSGTVVFSGQINVSGNYTYTSGTLTTTGSTLVFYCNNTTCTVTPGTISYNNVQIVTYAGTVAIASGSTMKVGGSLTTNETYGSAYGNINTGTIEVSGDYITSAAFNGGNGLVRMVGTGTISSSGGATPKVEINTAGTITLSGSNHFRNDFTYVAGTVVNTGSTTYFDGSTQTISGGSMVFNDVTFNGNFANPTVSGTMNVGGNLTFAAASASSVNGGTIAVSGNVTLTTLSNGGTVALTFNGTGTQTVSRASGTWPTGNWIINKASGTLTLGSAVSLGGAAQSVTLTSGAINMAGYAFSMKSLSLNGNTLTKNAGVLTVNGVVQGTGSLFGGTVNP